MQKVNAEGAEFMKYFKKFDKNPVLGSETLGSVFDAYVSKENKMFRMDVSLRKKKSCAVSFSADGITWSEPVITLAPNPRSGWEDNINRNCVLCTAGVYRMWYTGQANGHSWIGYAESTDGYHFERKSVEPVLAFEHDWEGDSVMNPCVLYEAGKYKMWYSAGDTYEPNVIAYAESDDGVNWTKWGNNPIFGCNNKNYFEQDRIGGCSIVKTDDLNYLMFYIGYEDIDTARICVARSENGITNWERSCHNPLIVPAPGEWDGDACYKPAVIWNEKEKKWMLWYNGRRQSVEYIGLADCSVRDLFQPEHKVGNSVCV